MALLPLIKYGNPILRKKTNPVEDFNIQKLIDDMFETMYHEKGIGLAANQVGENLSILVFDIGDYDHSSSDIFSKDIQGPQVFINPEVIEEIGKCSMEEGCLSVPDIRAEIVRPESITLRYQNINKEWKNKSFSGLEARVLLHEIDHLNGKIFTDYLSPTKRTLINKRLLEIAKNGQPSTGIIV